MRCVLYALAALVVLGCSGMQQIEFQNDGPDDVEVKFISTRGIDRHRVEDQLFIPKGEATLEGVWYGSVNELLVEARWPASTSRRVFSGGELKEARQFRSANGIIGLSLSPSGFRLISPSWWVRIQNPVYIPLGLVIICIAYLVIRGQRRARQPV